MKDVLTKIDVARKQLTTAINLLFDEGDLVPIYSLATNAWEIIDALCTKEGVESLSSQTRENIKDLRDLKSDFINSPYRNFFKHADRDANNVLPALQSDQVDSILYLAVEDYLRLLKKSPIEIQVFQLWYLALNITKVSSSKFDLIKSNTESIFPNIEKLSRSQQLSIGKSVLIEAYANDDLMTDPQTENFN